MGVLSIKSSGLFSYDAVDDKSVLTIVKAIRDGVGQNVFSKIAEQGQFTMPEWSSYLHISERTLQRLKKEKRPFDSPQSERIIQIMLLFQLGQEVFGSLDKFNNWMETDNLALGRIMPKQLLDSAFGIDLVKDELIRIEQGVLA